MRKYWPTILIFILFISLLGYVIYTWGYKPSSPSNTQKIFDISQDQVSSVEVKTPESKYEVKKEDKHYSLFIPEEVGSYESYLEGIVTGATGISYQMIISENEQNLAQFGLDNPSNIVTINLKDGSKKVLQIGKGTPTQDGFYVKEEGKNIIYKVDASTAGTLQKNINDIINKNVLAIFNTTDSNKIVLTVNGQAKTFDKKNNNWFVDGKQLNADKITQLTDTIKKLEVDGMSNKADYVDANSTPFIRLQVYQDASEFMDLSLIERDSSAYNVVMKNFPVQYYISKDNFNTKKDDLIKIYNEAMSQ
ncbi:MAG: DUF4340 domain-containing protein [Bacteroidota bacterium]|nr:DUF4340 domain-containing protein [Bacteroidota bacterium]